MKGLSANQRNGDVAAKGLNFVTTYNAEKSTWSQFFFVHGISLWQEVTFCHPVSGDAGLRCGVIRGDIDTTLNKCGYDASKHDCINVQMIGNACPLLTFKGIEGGYSPAITVTWTRPTVTRVLYAESSGVDWVLQLATIEKWVGIGYFLMYADFAKVGQSRSPVCSTMLFDDLSKAKDAYRQFAKVAGTIECCNSFNYQNPYTKWTAELEPSSLASITELSSFVKRHLQEFSAVYEKKPWGEYPRSQTWEQTFSNIQQLEVTGLCFDLWTGGLLAQNAHSILKNLANATKQASKVKHLARNLRTMEKAGQLTQVQYEGANYLINRQDYKATLNAVKSAAGTKLGTEWGLMAPVRDYAESHDVLKSWYKTDPETGRPVGLTPFWETAHGAKTSLPGEDGSRGYFATTVEYKPEGPETNWGCALALCRQVGFVPSWTKLWDVTPMSFAVNWAVNVEEFFKRQDAHKWANIIPLHTACEAVRHEKDVQYEWAGWTIKATLTYYERRYIPTSEVPKSFHTTDFGPYKGTLSLQNVDEAAALLIQFV